MANWGTNVDDSLNGVNSFLRQNSVVTTMYNFFGYSSFSGFLSIWAKQGLLSNGWADPHMPLIKCFNHGIKDNVYQHAQIESLTKYSRFVKVREAIALAPSFNYFQLQPLTHNCSLQFVVKTRAIFLTEFAKHKALFPGVDGEAMFVGTVLHSLDHVSRYIEFVAM